MKSKRIRGIGILLIVALLISSVAVLASCAPEDKIGSIVPKEEFITTVEFYVGDKMIDSYGLEGITIDAFPLVEPADGKVFFEWCADYDCEETFGGVVGSSYPIREGSKIKLYAKMVDPMYIEIDDRKISQNNKYIESMSKRQSIILKDTIFVGEGVDYTVYTDEALTAEFTDYAYTMLATEHTFYIKIDYKELTRTIIMSFYVNKIELSIKVYVHSERENTSGDTINVYTAIPSFDTDLMVYRGDIIDLSELHFDSVDTSAYEILGYTKEPLYNYSFMYNKTLDDLDLMNINSYEVKSSDYVYIVVKAIV